MINGERIPNMVIRTGRPDNSGLRKLKFKRGRKMIKKGDRVIMNDKYYVSEKNKGKEFIVTTEPTEVCGTLSVWLEGIRGCYAIDGLTKVN